MAIMFSNIFLILPVIYAGLYGERLYLFFASGVFVFSPLYHWYQIRSQTSARYRMFERLDWFFALGAFLYMYYYIYFYNQQKDKLLLLILLSAVVLFYWLGRRFDYQKLHPWFHVAAPLVSSAILVLAHMLK